MQKKNPQNIKLVTGREKINYKAVLYVIWSASITTLVLVLLLNIKGQIVKQSTCNLFVLASGVLLSLLVVSDYVAKLSSYTEWKVILFKAWVIIIAGAIGFIGNQRKDELSDASSSYQRNIINGLSSQIKQTKGSISDSLNSKTKTFLTSLKTRTENITAQFIAELDKNSKAYIEEQKKVIQTVKDSAKKQTTVQKITPPELYLDSIRIIDIANDFKRINMMFKNWGSLAKNIKINVYCIGVNNGEYVNIFGPYPINIDQLTQSKSSTWPFDFKKNDFHNYTEYDFYFEGSYQDQYNAFYPFLNIVTKQKPLFLDANPNGNLRVGLIGIFKSHYPHEHFTDR